MKIYAKQVPPEYQNSDVFGDEIYTDWNVFDGSYVNHCSDVFNRVYRVIKSGELENAWYDLIDGYSYYGTTSWARILNDIVPPLGRETYTRQERKTAWPELIDRCSKGSPYDFDDVLCDALELVTGREYKISAIRGCCQGDYMKVCYPVDEWSADDLQTFEILYWNLGSEWNVFECDDDGNKLDNYGYYTYYTQSDAEDVKAAMSEEFCLPLESITLDAFEGWSRVARYKAV